jgi:hypothetical protein
MISRLLPVAWSVLSLSIVIDSAFNGRTLAATVPDEALKKWRRVIFMFLECAQAKGSEVLR